MSSASGRFFTELTVALRICQPDRVTDLLLIAVAVFGYAMVSGRLERSPITAPMVFTTVGILVGTGGLGIFQLDLDGESARLLVEATLVLVLFTDAVRIDLRALRRESWLPARLLGIGLPLTLVLGTLAAKVILPEISWIEAALVAAVLAPTDAALGQAVVSDPRLPERIRQGINVESGLNDGIVLPVVTVLLAVAAAEAADGGVSRWGEFLARQIGFGLLSGVLAGGVGGRLLDRLASAGRVEGVYRQLAALSVAVAAFAGAEVLEGNGFIAAFTAGLVFGAVARDQSSHVQDFAQDEGELLTAITFVIFGAVLVGGRLGDLTWPIALYVLVSLVVVRVVAVLIALLRSGAHWETRLFVGWFGPRGLASILFGLLVLEELGGADGEAIVVVVVWTVLVSVYAHGASASLWSGRLGRRLSDAPETMPEMGPATEMPTRRSP